MPELRDPERDTVTTCSRCPAEIVWAVTEKGAKIPLDAKPEKRTVLVPMSGEVVVRRSRDVPTLPDGSFGLNVRAVVVDTFMPHHATCPAVASFRKG